MAWYTIPKISPQYTYSEAGNMRGVLINAKEFQKFIDFMEDLEDIIDIEKAKKVKGRLYSFEEISAMIESKKK